MEVRGFCVQYTKRKNRERRNAEKSFTTKDRSFDEPAQD